MNKDGNPMITITKEEAQAVWDLSAGYTLGNADVEILQRLARVALVSLEAEPVSFDALRDAVAEVSGGPAMQWGDLYKGHQAVPFINFNSLARIVDKFRVATQAPVVPEEMTRNPDVDVFDPGFMSGWNACRAASMKHGGDSTNGKALTSGDTVANPPAIPDDWVMVPVEPTEKMINAWLSEVANWRGHVAGYKAMLSAAPQQEMKDISH